MHKYGQPYLVCEEWHNGRTGVPRVVCSQRIIICDSAASDQKTRCISQIGKEPTRIECPRFLPDAALPGMGFSQLGVVDGYQCPDAL